MAWVGYVIYWAEAKACIAESLRAMKRIVEVMVAAEESYLPLWRVMQDQARHRLALS